MPPYVHKVTLKLKVVHVSYLNSENASYESSNLLAQSSSLDLLHVLAGAQQNRNRSLSTVDVTDSLSLRGWGLDE